MALVKSLRQWQLWRLPAAARAYVLGIDALAVATIGAIVARDHDNLVGGLTGLAVFSVGAALSVEVFRRIGTTHRGEDKSFHDLNSAFVLGGALVLPRPYVVALVLFLAVLRYLRALRLDAVKAVFNTSLEIVLCGAAMIVRSALAPGGLTDLGAVRSMTGSGAAVLSVVAAAATYLVLNKVIIIGLLRQLSPGTPLRSLLGDREGWTLAVVDGCAAVVLALTWANSAAFFLIALAPVLLLQRSVVYKHLIEMSRTDTKTGLANPSHWRTVAGRVVTRVQHAGGSAAVLMVDLDHFKAINDNFGHLVGDKVLTRVAAALNETVRGGDLVGRFGGEEFSLLLVGADLVEAVGVADRVRYRIAAMKVPVDGGKKTARITASVGVAVFGRHGADLEELLLGADTALYQAKAAGRDRVFIAPDRPVGPVAGIGLEAGPTGPQEPTVRSAGSVDDPSPWHRIDPAAPGDPSREPSLGTPARRPVR